MNELTRDELQTIIWFLRNSLWNICVQKFPQDILSEKIQDLVQKIDDCNNENEFSSILGD